jgi:hypothetical protein
MDRKLFTQKEILAYLRGLVKELISSEGVDPVLWKMLGHTFADLGFSPLYLQLHPRELTGQDRRHLSFSVANDLADHNSSRVRIILHVLS